MNSWIEQCYPDLAADAPVPLEPVLRYLDDTYLPDPANWPGDTPTTSSSSRILPPACWLALLLTLSAPTVRATTANCSRSLQPSCSLHATGKAPMRDFLTLLNSEPTAAEEYLQEAIANAPESLPRS